MKEFIVFMSLVVSTAAQANMTCIETAKSKKIYDTLADKIVINPSNGGQRLWVQVHLNDGKVLSTVANRDDHDSYKDKEAQKAVYNLDEEYNRKEEARFVTADSKIAGSDGDSIIFVDKSILKGEPGHLSLSSGQANDGESGDAWIWGRVGAYYCK